MDILEKELKKNEKDIKNIYKVFFILEAIALLYSSAFAMLLIFISFLPFLKKIEKMKKENDLIINKFKHLLEK